MDVQVLILDNASLLAMRLKHLLELQGFQVTLMNHRQMEKVPSLTPYQLVAVDHMINPALAEELRQASQQYQIILLLPEQSSQAHITNLSGVFPDSSVIYPSLSNKEILDVIQNLIVLPEEIEAFLLPKILLMDDVKERLAPIEKCLIDVGIQVTSIHDLASLEETLRHQSPDDIFICDFHMKELDGLEAFRLVKTQYPDCQCILLTSRESHDSLIETIRLGVSDVLKKPIDQNVLLQSIHRLWQTEMLKQQNQALVERLQTTVDTLVEKDILLRVIFDNTPDGIVLVDDKGCITEANVSCEYIFGLSRESLVFCSIRKLLSRCSFKTLLQQIRQLKGEQQFSCEIQTLHTSGVETVMSLSCNRVDYHGRYYFAGIVRDISEIKYREQLLTEQNFSLEEKVQQRTQALEHAKEAAEQANRSKSEFLANMSHELRTPMHSILSFARFAHDSTTDPELDRENMQRYLSRITTSGNRLLVLLNNLLDLSKLEAGKFPFYPGYYPLTEVIRQTESEFMALAKEKEIQLILTQKASDDKVWCDQEHIQLILRNLIGNAIKFSPNHGIIKIEIQDSYIRCYGRDRDSLCIRVIDEGVGIPEKELDQVFDKFVQSSKTNQGAGGTGLGLSICKELIQLHHGKIFATNNEHKGATFTFVLPKKEVQVQEAG